MNAFSLGRRLFAVALFVVVAAASADRHRVVAADATTAISGVVRSAAGAAIGGAIVSAHGPVRALATTDAGGGFTLALPAGIYTITVSKPGFDAASTPDVAVVAGQTLPLTITLSEQNLSTLRTIGSVTTNGRGASTINTGAANQTVVSGTEFAQLGNPQINDVLQRVPDVVIQKLGTQQDTAIVVGGLQPYETQVLIDGHPIALGQYGVYLSQYFPTFLIGSAETQSGPGNTTPFANIAVGGTVNLQTTGFTKRQTAEFNIGTDNFGSQNVNASVTGSAGKLEYVAGLGVAGANGYYFGKQECDTYNLDPATSPNAPGTAGIVAFCGNFSGSLYSRAQLYKAKYDFSPATSFDVDVLSSTGGYLPQGSAWGASYGPTTIEQCIPGTLECTNPADQNLVGKTINGFYWFPGTDIINNQSIFSGQFRTSIGNNTLLIRPYLGSIQPETYNGAGEGAFPDYYSPPNGYTVPPAPGQPTPAPGQPTPPPYTYTPSPTVGAAGSPTNTNPFEIGCPPGTVNSFSQINSPANTVTSTNGQEECYQYPYSTFEIDKLYGSTASFIHPIQNGAGVLDFTYDFHGQSTFAYANAPGNVQVPLSSTRYSTFSLTGSVHPTEKLAANFGLYNTNWSVFGEQPTFDSTGAVTGTTGLDRTVSRFDPHVAFAYRLDRDTSLRAATGTSETFPFVGDVSGPAASQPAAFLYTAGIVTEKNANLQPEYSIAYELGGDHRFGNGSVLSLDLQDTVVHNVFQQLTTQETVTLSTGQPGILGVFKPINVARLEARLATLKYNYAPARGLGFNLALTADRSILTGIPVSAYNSSVSLPANGVQVCGNAQFTPGLATCVPYLKGYGQFTYTFPKGTFLGLGADYEGKNNAYYQPPFAIADFKLRQPISKMFEFNFSVENLFNTNSYDYLPQPYLGVPAVGDSTTDGVTVQQGSYPTYRIPAATRTAHMSLRAHIGR
jgi:hypothetical protein